MSPIDGSAGRAHRIAVDGVAARGRRDGVSPSVVASAAPPARPATHPIAVLRQVKVHRYEALAFTAALVGAFAAILVERWQEIGTYVAGNDPGSWLALGRQLFGGRGRSAGGTYPPLGPLLVHGAQALFAPMDAARLVGLGSLAAVTAATLFVALQGMDRWLALAVAVGVGLSAEVSETVAFGGYPQNYGYAFLLVAAVAFAVYLQAGSRRWLALSSVSLAGAALSHHVYYLLACLVVALIWLLWLATKPGKRRALLRTLAVAVASLPSVAYFAPVFLILRRDGYGAPLSAGGMNAQLALRQAVAEARWLWIPVIATGSVFIAFSFPPRRFAVWAVAAALLLATLLLFPATGEIRLLPLLSTGALLGVGLGLEELRRRSTGTIWSKLPLTAAAVFVVLLYPLANADAAAQLHYYRVADRSLLNTTAWIAGHADQHRVVVREDGRNWPVGWWFEGLTRATIVVGSDPRWLAFPQERENAALVDRFFDPQENAEDVRALAATTNVRFLVFRKDWSDWQRWAAQMIPPFTVVYDDGEYEIVDVLGGAGSSTAGSTAR